MPPEHGGVSSPARTQGCAMSGRWQAVFLCIVGLMSMSAASCRTDPESARREYLASGDRYANHKQYREAIVQYRNAIQQDPQFGEARFKLAEAYMQVGDVQQASREYVRAAD